MSNKTSLFYIFKNGIIGENPILRLMIGLCSVLAVSVKVENCLAMGAAVIFVTTCSSMVISLCPGRLTTDILSGVIEF